MQSRWRSKRSLGETVSPEWRVGIGFYSDVDCYGEPLLARRNTLRPPDLRLGSWGRNAHNVPSFCPVHERARNRRSDGPGRVPAARYRRLADPELAAQV